MFEQLNHIKDMSDISNKSKSLPTSHRIFSLLLLKFWPVGLLYWTVLSWTEFLLSRVVLGPVILGPSC